MTTPAFHRIVRRETHSPRTVAMIIAVVILILALVYVGVEIVLDLLSQEFAAHKCDIKWLLGELARSQTYQRASGASIQR